MSHSLPVLSRSVCCGTEEDHVSAPLRLHKPPRQEVSPVHVKEDCIDLDCLPRHGEARERIRERNGAEPLGIGEGSVSEAGAGERGRLCASEAHVTMRTRSLSCSTN